MAKVGRTTKGYRTSWGDEIKGLTKTIDGRWRISANQERFTKPDERRAVAFFNTVMASLNTPKTVKIDGAMPTELLPVVASATSHGEAIKVSQAYAEALQEKVADEFKGDDFNAIGQRDICIGYDLPETVVWEWLREQLIMRPEYVAKMIGIPELAALKHLPIPKKSLRLQALLDAYLEHGNGTAESKRLAENIFSEFMNITQTQTLADLTLDTQDL